MLSINKKAYQTEWRTVFIITAVIYFIGGTQSIFLTSGELQDWAKNSSTIHINLRQINQGTIIMNSKLQNTTTN